MPASQSISVPSAVEGQRIEGAIVEVGHKRTFAEARPGPLAAARLAGLRCGVTRPTGYFYVWTPAFGISASKATTKLFVHLSLPRGYFDRQGGLRYDPLRSPPCRSKYPRGRGKRTSNSTKLRLR